MRTRSFLARWLFGATILAAGCSSGAGSAGLTSALPGPEQPDITVAGQRYGQLVLADLDQGAVLNLPPPPC